MKRIKARAAKADGMKTEVGIAIPVFGFKTHISIGRKRGFVRRFGLFVRTIGPAPARFGIDLANLANLADNLQRFIWIETRAATT